MDTTTDKPIALNPTPDSFTTTNNAEVIPITGQPSNPFAALPANHPDNPAWGILAAVSVWFGSVALLVAGGLAALAIYAGYRLQTMNFEEVMRAAQTDPLFILISVVVVLPTHLLTFGMGWVLVTSFGKRPFGEAVGWSWGAQFGFWKCAGLAIGLWLCGILLAKLIGGQETDLERIIASSNAARFGLAFLAVATAPIVEEVVYRGVLFPPLQRSGGTSAAIVIVSLLFASVHVIQYWNNLGVIAAVTLLSFVLTWVRARTGRLLPCFVIHFVFNGVQAILIVAEPYLKTLSPQSPEPPPGMIIASLARAFGVGL
ncbi:MAG: CPBP family intramembrane glutamic endopeptidase [Pyrinomonadaceae bacterium]